MKLTGKAEVDFEKWFFENCNSYDYEFFYLVSESMQFGLYVDFFDSVGLKLGISPENEHFCFILNDSESGFIDTRHEARTAALKSANEIYNSKFNKPNPSQ